MNNKLAILYGIVISVLVLVHVFTFFQKKKEDKTIVVSDKPAVSVKMLMDALQVKCFTFDAENMAKQKEKGIFFEVLDGDKVIRSRQISVLVNRLPEEPFCLFVWKNGTVFNFSLMNGNHQFSWQESFPGKAFMEMWTGQNNTLKAGDIFYHGLTETASEGMIFRHGKGRKFRIAIKKNSFPFGNCPAIENTFVH